MAVYSTLAAVDLGSNSFHLQVARVVGDQIYPLDSLREPVRLGAGLGKDKRLDDASQQRALDCLKRFGERLRGFDPHAVRVAGTNTFRVAKNAPAFLKQAQAALGFPIEIVAGKEEARLIYLGVAHGLPVSQARRLVVDIGGGSTECIIGRGFKPLRLASLYMGCVSYSLRYFPDGKITRNALRRAELAARSELQPIAASFKREGWQGAFASSGSARALAEILRLNGLASNGNEANEDAGITPQGLEQLRALLLKTGDVQKLNLEGLRPDRIPVLPGGFAIMSAVLSELEIPRIQIASGAMREGLLYDLLGRVQHHDMRDATVEQFMRRYHVDSKQAKRVGNLALALYQRFMANEAPALKEDEHTPQILAWAAKLHEIGISVSYSGYHKHSAYIIENADMPGFSKMEQSRIARLVLAHRRSLKKLNPANTTNAANAGIELQDWKAVMALRLAALFYRSRADIAAPTIHANVQAQTLQLTLDRHWLARNPLTATALHEEIAEWREAGITLDIPALHAPETNNGNESEAEAA